MTPATPFSKTRVWIRIVLAALVFLAAVVFFWPKGEKTPPLETFHAENRTLVKTVLTTGRVVPNFEVEIKGKASGKIIRLPFDVSDPVHEGDLLVELDPIDESRSVSQAAASLSGLQNRVGQSRLNLQVARQTLSTDLARAQADLTAARAKAGEDEARARRLQALVDKRYISQEEYETGMSQATQSGSALANAQTRLKELQTQKVALEAQAKDVSIAAADARAQSVALASSQQRLSETRILAPISGVVTTRSGQIGQIVASGINNVSGGTAIMTIADLSRIFVLASVDESDIGQVRLRQHVSITVDAFPGETFQGAVTRISPKGVEESNVVTFEVQIEITGANKTLLKPEMTANAEILIERRKDVLSVPVDAIVTRNGKTFVTTLNARNKPSLVPVVTGLNDGAHIEIISGITEQTTLVENVDDGQPDSKWRKDRNGKPGPSDATKRQQGQRMMMRSMGRR
ncbi:MAG: efflux RND transporter periplasmic adaptor subunit [Candidatus Melainabacteria bacterium]